jgi:hypothetical protein
MFAGAFQNRGWRSGNNLVNHRIASIKRVGTLGVAVEVKGYDEARFHSQSSLSLSYTDVIRVLLSSLQDELGWHSVMI